MLAEGIGQEEPSFYIFWAEFEIKRKTITSPFLTPSLSTEGNMVKASTAFGKGLQRGVITQQDMVEVYTKAKKEASSSHSHSQTESNSIAGPQTPSVSVLADPSGTPTPEGQSSLKPFQGRRVVLVLVLF